jgi:hypothetical protein
MVAASEIAGMSDASRSWDIILLSAHFQVTDTTITWCLGLKRPPRIQGHEQGGGRKETEYNPGLRQLVSIFICPARMAPARDPTSGPSIVPWLPTLVSDRSRVVRYTCPMACAILSYLLSHHFPEHAVQCASSPCTCYNEFSPAGLHVLGFCFQITLVIDSNIPVGLRGSTYKVLPACRQPTSRAPARW